MSNKDLTTDICIVGAGPAGMIAGLLLARNGIKVTVVESHQNFERDFRGEVLMPRFVRTVKQVGLWEHIESYPHLKLQSFEIFLKDKILGSLNFSELSKEIPFAIWMPQPILLNALLDQAKEIPNFNILFGVTVRDLIREGRKVIGILAEREGEKFEIHAAATVGADGRYSIVRKAGNFEFEYEHYDFDVVWFTCKESLKENNTVRAFFSNNSRYLVLPKYPDLVQCGLIVDKGEFSTWRARGIELMRQELLDGHPVMHNFARQLKDFSAFSVLQARVSYVKDWAQDGCLLIGDAAHTCSPAGAVGVSVAAATAVAAAEVLTEAFKKNDFSRERLCLVEKMRGDEVKKIQKLQANFTSVVFLKHRWLRWLSIAAIVLAVKTGIMRRFQKRLLIGKK